MYKEEEHFLSSSQRKSSHPLLSRRETLDPLHREKVDVVSRLKRETLTLRFIEKEYASSLERRETLSPR